MTGDGRVVPSPHGNTAAAIYAQDETEGVIASGAEMFTAAFEPARSAATLHAAKGIGEHASAPHRQTLNLLK